MQVNTGLRIRAALFSLYGDGIPSVLPSSQSSVLPSAQSSVLPSAQTSDLPTNQSSALRKALSSPLHQPSHSTKPQSSPHQCALHALSPCLGPLLWPALSPFLNQPSVLPSALYGWPLVYGYDSRIVPYLCGLRPRKRGRKGHFVAAAKQKIVLLRLFNVSMLPHFSTLIYICSLFLR